ncbi:DUF6428 family protein [Croceivirga thetidis]|uniref:Phage tail protein n=1 Tax=Croceivirga thetidis TaxID=2721623 RepID=A0ABX1GP43_9FLAO|nr:DUF6428 family protein [Croceivirga thetidis]NKI30835.1 hypothetical protein [Croceivirga thetidis]
MITSEFLSLLEDHKNKSLLFEYQPGQLVPANYHITEVKNIAIESVDCGAGTDAWKETIIQLWESPSEIGKTEFMSSYKALGILNKVDKMRAMDREAELKIEYSNDQFHTAQLFIDDYTWNNEKLVFKLSIKKTDCKAKETCGVPTEAVVKSGASSCAPGSGCC